MAWRSVTERLRSTLIVLFKQEGWGSATRLEEFSRRRREHTALKPLTVPQLSMFLRSGRGLKLDFLDDIAAFFRISVGELFGPIREGDLRGAEHRLLLAYRAIPEPIQHHCLALLEHLAIGIRATGTPIAKTKRRGARSTGDALPPADLSASDQTVADQIRTDLTRAAERIPESARRRASTEPPAPPARQPKPADRRGRR